jgi:hypothetical protein
LKRVVATRDASYVRKMSARLKIPTFRSPVGRTLCKALLWLTGAKSTPYRGENGVWRACCTPWSRLWSSHNAASRSRLTSDLEAVSTHATRCNRPLAVHRTPGAFISSSAIAAFFSDLRLNPLEIREPQG